MAGLGEGVMDEHAVLVHLQLRVLLAMPAAQLTVQQAVHQGSRPMQTQPEACPA